jgi:hypothetical protein
MSHIRFGRAMNCMVQSFALCILAICLMQTSAAAQAPRDGYPGVGLDGELHYIALNKVMLGTYCFHKVYARWPVDWAEVRDSGIVQVPLMGFDLQEIDPDEASVTEFGDLHYAYDPTTGNATVHVAVNKGGFAIEHHPLSAGRTYQQWFAIFDEGHASLGIQSDSYVSRYSEDTDKLRQFAILNQIYSNLELFKSIKGDYPHTIAEFLRSGLGPVDDSSINPVTGLPFRFDGSPNDIFYRYVPGGSFMLKHVDSDPDETLYFTY